MASRVNRGQLVVPNENLHILRKKPIVDENTNNLKTNTKKAGAKLGGRKALIDITNKSSLSHDVSLKKNSVTKEECNVAEERFLHDHRKCVEAQQTVFDSSLLDLVLPGRGADTFSTDGFSGFDEVKVNVDDPHCHQEPEEMPISEFFEWSEPSLDLPPSLTFHMDSPPSSPLAWHFEIVEFTLRPGDDDA